jgi:hypothetical protein
VAMRVRDATEWTANEVRRHLRAPHWGIRSLDPVSTTIDARCQDFLPRVGDAFFSHGTAGLLWGLPLPRRIEGGPLHVAFARGHRAPDTRDVVGHELSVRDADIVILRGLAVTSVARTIRDLSSHLLLRDLVAIMDAAMHRGLVTASDLVAQGRTRGFRGRAQFIAATQLMDAAAASRPETHLRLAYLGAGLPPMDVNVDLFDRFGTFLARPDLRFRGYPVVSEYDGSGHLTDPAQWRRDVERYALMEDADLAIVRALADDAPLFPRAISRSRRALARVGWRD